MAKRKFRIEAGRYGGELTIGEVNADFVDYWLEQDDEGELIDHLQKLEWGDEPEVEGIPLIKENFYAWNECDDIEHVNSAYADSRFIITEVPADGSDDYLYHNYEDEVVLDPHQLHGREAYVDNSKPDDLTDYKPVLVFHSAEKGSFGVWFVETDGEDIDMDEFAYTLVETPYWEQIENVYYKKEELEIDYDYAESTGKGYHAMVGYMNMKWHDPFSKYTEEYLNEQGIWEEYDDEVAEKKKERATTIPLNISVNEIVGEVGTIDNPGFEVDPDVVPLINPPVVEDAEAETYKDFQQSMVDLNSDGNEDLGEDGENIKLV